MMMKETKGMKLVSKKVKWVPGEGVRSIIELSTSIPYFSGLGKMLTTKYNHEVCITGIDEATVSLKVGGPNSEKDKWEADVHDWLATTDYLAEWEKEAANYRYVVSQVGLPAPASPWGEHIAYTSFSVDYHVEPCALCYKLMLGQDAMALSVVVVAKYDWVTAYVGVLEDNDCEGYNSYVGMNEYRLRYPVTVDSVKAVLGPAIDAFVGKLRALADMDVVVEVDEYY